MESQPPPRDLPSSRTRIKETVSRLHEKMRGDCLSKSRMKRQELLSQHRGIGQLPSSSDVFEADMTAGIRQLVREEVDMVFNAAAAAALAASSTQSPQPGAAPSFSRVGQYPSPVTPIQGPRLHWDDIAPGSGIDVLTMEEVEAARRELEEQLYSSMIAEELDRIEAEQQEQLNSMVEAYERDTVMTDPSAADGSALPCPVCGQANLILLNGVLSCPAERWRLDLRSESVSPEWLRQSLAEAYETHAAGPCRGRLTFSVEATTIGGTATEFYDHKCLVARCKECGTLNIIA